MVGRYTTYNGWRSESFLPPEMRDTPRPPPVYSALLARALVSQRPPTEFTSRARTRRSGACASSRHAGAPPVDYLRAMLNFISLMEMLRHAVWRFDKSSITRACSAPAIGYVEFMPPRRINSRRHA